MKKVLCLVDVSENDEILSKKPEKVYIRGTSINQIDSFMENTRKIHEETKTRKRINEAQYVRTLANFEEIEKMGFVHISEFDRLMEKKVLEVYNRVRIEFYYDFFVKRPIKKLGMRLFKRLGFHWLKNNL
jgi:hypothetical protein